MPRSCVVTWQYRSGFTSHLIKDRTAAITQGKDSEGAWNFFYRKNPSPPNSECGQHGFSTIWLDRTTTHVCEKTNSPQGGQHPFTVPLQVRSESLSLVLFLVKVTSLPLDQNLHSENSSALGKISSSLFNFFHHTR